MDIKNSTILITGGTSGIGLEMAKQLVALGAADIIITGRDARKLNQIKIAIPQIHAFQSDVGKPEDNREMYTLVTSQFPKLNILINNAGIMRNVLVPFSSKSGDTKALKNQSYTLDISRAF